MSHESVVKNFAERKVNSRRKTVSWGGGNVFCEDDLIYSYGHHFPMAKYLGQKGSGLLNNFYIKNGDRYSVSTASHQSMVQHLCKGPTVSRSAISAAGFKFEKLTMEDIVCYRSDFTKHCYKDRKTGRHYEEAHTRRSSGWGEAVVDSGAEFFTGAFEDELTSGEWKPPHQGMFIPHYKRQGDAKDRIVAGYWHILGAVVLQRDNAHYLCSLDEGSYFVSKLPVKVKTVEQAFKCLRPKAVLQAERKGLEVKRQGEWFFIPAEIDNIGLALALGINQKGFKELLKEAILPLPSKNQNSNLHVCCQVVVGDAIYTRGNVYHRWSFQGGRSTGQHKMVRLGDEWHTVHRNTELAAWSQGGRFD